MYEWRTILSRRFSATEYRLSCPPTILRYFIRRSATNTPAPHKWACTKTSWTKFVKWASNTPSSPPTRRRNPASRFSRCRAQLYPEQLAGMLPHRARLPQARLCYNAPYESTRVGYAKAHRPRPAGTNDSARIPERVSSVGGSPSQGRSRLKYVCLVYGEEKKIGALTDDECMAYDQALRNSGRCLASEALQPVHTAATVRVRNGKVCVRDGPFTETKECLAGFYLIDA